MEADVLGTKMILEGRKYINPKAESKLSVG
jgi:hypothetical protein